MINHASLTVSDEEESDDLEDQIKSPKNERNAMKCGMDKETYARLLNQMRKEEAPNYSDAKVDFNEQLNAHKKRTEKELPFTMT